MDLKQFWISLNPIHSGITVSVYPKKAQKWKNWKLSFRCILQKRQGESVKNAWSACDYVHMATTDIVYQGWPSTVFRRRTHFLDAKLASQVSSVVFQIAQGHQSWGLSGKNGIFVLSVEGINHLWYFIRSSSNDCYSNPRVIFPVTSPGHNKQVETCSLSQEEWGLPLIGFDHRNDSKHWLPGPSLSPAIPHHSIKV